MNQMCKRPGKMCERQSFVDKRIRFLHLRMLKNG